MSKKEKGNGILIPILSALDGLVLIGTASIVAFGMATAQVEPERPTVKLADACRIISTIQRDANEAVLENIDVPSLEETAPTEAPEATVPVNTEAPQPQEPPQTQEKQPEDVTASASVETTTEQKEDSSGKPPTPKTTANATPSNADPPIQQQSPAVVSNQSTVTSTAQTPRPTTGSNGSYTHDFSGGRVLITKASNNKGNPVYHIKDCVSAQKIPPENESWYESAEAAKAAGRSLCGNCGK